MTGRTKFLEGHDIHVLCESPSSWHLLDGYGLRLPCPAPTDQSLRAQFNIRMLTVVDLSLTVVQLIQVDKSFNIFISVLMFFVFFFIHPRSLLLVRVVRIY